MIGRKTFQKTKGWKNTNRLMRTEITRVTRRRDSKREIIRSKNSSGFNKSKRNQRVPSISKGLIEKFSPGAKRTFFRQLKLLTSKYRGNKLV